MPKSYAERNAKKKKKEFVNSQTPSVSQRNTPAKEEARRQRFNNNSNRRLTASERAAAARDQKMGLPTSEEIRRAEEERKRKAEERRQTVQRQQRVKSGIQTEEDNQYFQERRDTAKRALKNTPTLAKKAIKDTGSGYMQTLADVDEMVKSNEKWTSAKAMKMGIDTNDKKQMQDIEEERKRNVEESRKFRLELNEAQEKRQAEWDKRSKGAKGLEKAYYGAVESGVGMAADLAVGALSGTGQLGALASMGVRTYGTVRGQAEKEGATENEDRLYSLMQAGKEVGTELMFAGAGLARGAYAGSKSLSIADRVASRVTRNMTGRAADAAYAGVRLLGGTAEENIEEIAGWGLDPLIRDVAYGKNLRKRQQKEILQAESDALRSNIRSEDDVRAVSAMLGSDDFLETYKNQYVGAGLSEKQATKVAEKMRDYLTASLTGDTDKMADLEDEIANLVGNKGLSASDWNKQELKETIASTSLLTLTTGLPGNVSTAVKGASIRDQLGESGINELVSAAVDFEDETASKRAQVAKDRLAEGKELTATQVYELTVAQDQQVRKDQQRLSAKNNMVQATIQNDNLVMPRIVLNNDGSISGDEIVTQEYTRNANEAAEAIRNKSKESLTDTEVDNGSRAIAGFMTGAFTIGDANTLTYSNEAVREAFKDATGVDLEQYVVRDKNGKVKIPETNAKTKDALFAMAADNFVQTAQAETENWMDHASGEVITQVNKRLGASGTVALQNALQDVDVRDRTNYLMTTNALDMTYQAGRNIGTEWDNIKDTVIATYPGVDDTKLQAVYEAGRSDRDAANDNARDRAIKKGQSVKEMGEQGEVAGNLLIETKAPPKETVIRTFTEIASTLGVNIHLTDQILDEKGEEVTGANGSYFKGEIYLNVSTAVEKNVGYIFMHEVTHHLKQFAPEEYQALENLVRERWFKADAEQMQAAIQRKIDAYAKEGQNLSEENALEEIIADAAHEFINDRNFARQVADESPSLAKAILNSIRNGLRMLRQIMSKGTIEDETHMNSLFSELNILSEAEELWLNAYKVAVQNRAANAIEQWDENARNQNAESEEAGFSLSDSNISSYSTDAYSGQVNMRTEYKDDSGNVLGYVEWNDYEGEPNISYIHVNEDSRRQGIARKLLQNIQKQYPGTEINFGMTTEDGTALLDAVTDTVVDDEIKSRQDELAQKNQELASIESRLNELYDVDERTPEQESEASELGEQWDNLYREIHDLNEEVGDRSSTRRMVRLSVTEDSVGRRLTEAQKEYFKDSKLVDEDGHLYVMYHGTENEFTVFNFSQGGKNGTAEGYGIYLSNSQEVTQHYGGRQIESYVNMTRPATAFEQTITQPELRKLIAATVDYEAQEMLDEYDGDVEAAKKDTWISNYTNTSQTTLGNAIRETAKSITRFNGNDMDIVQEIMNGMGIRDYDGAMRFYDILTATTGIDGFVTRWGDEDEMLDPNNPIIAVAFRSNQVKNIDNENPTEDPDIRYSVTAEQDAEYMDAVNNGENKAAQKMVDRASRDAGFAVKGYHGTTADFKSFKPGDIGIHFGKNKSTARTRVGRGKNTKIIPAWIALNNPIQIDVDFGSWDADYRLADYLRDEGVITPEEHQDALTVDNGSRRVKRSTKSANAALRDILKSKGYDGIEYINYYEADGATSYIVFDSEQVKSAEPFTYDDNGNVIPLSERFNEETPDIRYSFSDDQLETLENEAGPNIRFSKTTEFDVLPKAAYTTNAGYSGYVMNASGRQLRLDLNKANFSEAQANAVDKFMKLMADWFDETGEGSLQYKYRFIGWQDLTDATVQVKRNDAGEIVGVTVSAMVKNGEYPVNFDLTTVCNKREGVTDVIKNLMNTKVPGTNESVLNSIKLSDQNMWKINQALKAEGIDTACLGCFVEARRYYAQNFMDKIDDKWNSAVRKARRQLGLPENEYFNFAHGRAVTGEEWSSIDSLWTKYEESTESKSSPADRIKILMDEIVRNKEVDSPYLKLIQMSDILTPEGINGFKQLSNKGHDMVKTIKSIYGTSAPKEILAFTPYNSEIALLPDQMKGMGTPDYLRSIGGIRVQSFSDFKIEHVYEHFQMVADEAARKFVTHGYSKVIAFPRIFGLTGRKINMSVMFDVLPNKAWSQALGIPVRKARKYAKMYQGLQFVKEKPTNNVDNRPYKEVEIEGVHGYLTYLVSDADYVNSVYDRLYQENINAGMSEAQARRKANESKPFEQSINYREAVELENRDGYKENVGIIAVAYGDEHLKMLLADPNVRYIIPYHKSGLPTFISKKTSLAIARDYTNFQNTNIAETWKDANGKVIDLNKEYKKFLKENSGEKYPAIKFFKKINDSNYTVKFGSKDSSQKAAMAGTADFDVYKGLDKANEIQEISNAYLEHCIKNGWCPIFHEFAGDPNYYKMLFDFAVTDQDGNIYPQKVVRNVYPGIDIDAKVAAGEEITADDLAELKEAVEQGADEQNRKNMIRAQNMPNVMNDLLSRSTENSIIADTNIQSIQYNTPDYTNVKYGNPAMTPQETDDDRRLSISEDIDDAYMDAVKAEDMEEAQRLVDDAALTAGYTTKAYHGTGANFTVFDPERSGKNYQGFSKYGKGLYFSSSEEIANKWGKNRKVMAAYLDLKNPYIIKPLPIKEGPLLDEYNRLKIAGNPKLKPSKEEYPGFIIEMLNGMTNDNGYSTEFLKSLGYDGVVSDKKWDLTDWTETVVFDPEQIKSADAVTYAEDGSVIPLSERFNPDNNDIRYSLPTQDSDGNILTDGQMEYFKNSQARDEQGRLLPMYHATPNGGFTIFNPSYSFDGTSISFTDDLDFALNYAAEEDDIEAQVQASENRLGDGERRGRGHYEVYLNMENPLVVDGSDIVFNDEVYDLTAQAKHEGYDGLIMRNFQDLGADIYQVFSGKQVKDTRNTDPTNNPDIRYSIPSENAFIASASDAATSTDETWYTDPALEEGRVRYSYSKQDFINGKSDYWNPAWLTEGRVLDDKSVKRSIRTVVQGAMMNSNTPAQYRTSLVDSLVKDARKAFNLMKQGKHSEAAAMLFDSAYDMIENVEFFEDDTAFDRYKELRDYFKGFKLTIDERYYNDINIADYRKRNMGRILIGRNGTNIDEAWEDLSNRWPEWFSMDVEHPAEMLEQLEHVFDAAKPVAVAYSSEEAMEFAGDIADDLYDIVYEGKEFKSLADKYDAKTKAMKLRHQEAMQKMQDSLDAEKERRRYEVKKLKEENKRKLNTQKNKFEFEIAELRQNRDYNIERLKAEKSRAVQEERQKRKDAEARERAQKSHRKEFTRFQKNYDWLVSRLLSPTKDKNIPEELRIPLAKLMMQFDLQTQRSKDLEKKYGVANATLQLRELKDKITKIAKEDDSGELPANPWLIGSIEQLTDAFDGKPVDWMGTEDIILLNEVLSSLVHGIQNQQKVRINGKMEEIAGFGDKTIESLKDRIKKFGQRKSYIKGIDQINRLLNEGEETPIYFFSRIDPKKEGIGAMYRELRLGEDKHIRNMDYLRRRFKDITGEYAKNKQPGSRLEDWRSMHNAQTFELANGTITLTPAQLMSLYCLSNRDDAKGHLLTGGIVATPVSFGATMKDALKPRDQKVSSTKITYEDLQSMITKLTPEQKKMADELQKLMAEEMAEWGNQTSMEMYGIKMFRDPNYFPMRSSQMELASDPNNPGKDTAEKIRNFGFTKPITPNANNAVYIDDIFSVVADHCNKMSLYNSMAIPIMDFMKVYNYKQRNDDVSTVTVKATIGDAFTTKANGYIEKFLADLNGNTQTKSDAVDALFKTALANYKKAAIGANMRVALQQPTAIFRAFQAIDPKWFAGVKPSSKAVKEMQEHCPIALWKSWGHYEMDMSRDMEDIMMNNDWSKMDTITMGLYGFLDNVTWGMIWQATKKEVKANNPDVEEGSEEFWNLCNERASEIFDKTQVVDSMFHRSETMRSKATLTKMATSFMAEPTLTYNVFRNSLVTGAEMWRSGDKAGARKTWGRTFTVLMFNAAAVSAGAAIWDAVRGKGDDEKDPKTKFQLFYDNFMANFGENAPWQMWHNIYFVKDIADIKKGVEEGWGGTSNMALEGFETMFRGWNQVKKKMHGEAKNTTWYDAFTNLIGGVGYILGIPSKTIMKDFKGICKSLGLDLQVFAATDSPAVLQNAMPEIEEGGWADKVVKLFTGSESGSSETSEGSSSGEGTSSGKTKDATSEAMKLGKKAVKNIGRNAYKKREKSEEEMLAEINEKTVGYSGADRDQRIWNIVSDGYSDYINKGDYEYIDKMRRVVQQAGGNLDSFDKKVMDASKTAMKKTIIANPTQAQVEQQDRIRDYLLTHGMSESEISAEICYKSNTARDLKAAMRLNNKDYMVEELIPLLRAGITRDDIYKLYKYRNMGAKTYDGKYSAPEYKQSTGKYEWPINGQITSGFGHRSSPGGIGSTNHQGLDIAGNMGDPIGAADGGTVVYVGWYGGAGNTVMIQHDDGTVTQYSHMSAFNCQEGDTVSQGQQIGQVGSTGNSTGPHCHFAVKVNDTYVDPLTYLQG